MKIDWKPACALVLLLAGSSSRAATIPEPVSGDYVIRGFRFASGETLPELKIHYRTLGSPRRDSKGIVRNAVLLLHGTTGSGKGFFSENFAGVLFGPGQLLDSEKYYLIVPDGIGHGESSRPSDGLRARLRRYNYDDMVDAERRLLSEGLNVNYLCLIIGTSMVALHSWIWGEKRPDFMAGLLPLAPVPARIVGRNRMF